jgi:hypothetical protein
MAIIGSSNPTKFAAFINKLEAQATADIAAKRKSTTLISPETVKITTDTTASESYKALIHACYTECLKGLANSNSDVEAQLAFVREFQIALGLGFRYAQYLQDAAGDSLQPCEAQQSEEERAKYMSDSERIRLENLKIDGGVN